MGLKVIFLCFKIFEFFEKSIFWYMIVEDVYCMFIVENMDIGLVMVYWVLI